MDLGQEAQDIYSMFDIMLGEQLEWIEQGEKEGLHFAKGARSRQGIGK